MINHLFETWNKNDKALSNNVYINDKQTIICKKYIKNDFSDIYGNQEIQIIKYLKNLKLLNKGKDFICQGYIEHEPFNSSKTNSEEVISIAKYLKKIHSLIDVKEIDDVIVPNYKKVWKFFEDNNNIIPKYDNEKQIFLAAMKIVNKNAVLANNDIVDGNILINYQKKEDGSIIKKIIFIDYEYGGINNKYFDIASFTVKRKISKELEEDFINEYFKTETFNKEEYKIAKQFVALFWSKWAWFKYSMTKNDIYKEIANWLYENRFYN